MKICLAGSMRKEMTQDLLKCPAILQSYYSIPEWMIPIVKKCNFFVLDSGAFTFMNTKKNKEIDFNEYLEKYINFINENDIKYFFELDIDVVVGLKEVERLRKRLEEGTGKKCIPVWHKSRGKEYFVKMCKEYDYVAIGGIVTKEIRPEEYKYFKWFIDTAHSYGCKIHGLGFTNLKLLKYFNFDSVDSTSWLSGGRFGTMYHFNGKDLQVVDTGNRRRRSDINHIPLDIHNFYEWFKFQKYAELYY